MSDYYLGIDVGLDGALALVTHHRRVRWVKDMPTLLDPHKKKTKSGKPSSARVLDEGSFLSFVHEALEVTNGNLFAVVERQQFFMGSNGESKKMEQFGFIKGILIALEIPFELVHPKTWQAGLKFPKKSAGDPKTFSIQRAQRIFPRAELVPPGSRKPRDGRADALNIVDYILNQRE